MRFHAFVSYARRSSTDQAVALKQGLEAYARKWNRARSTDVFLDDASLSAAPSLEGTLSRSLEESDWLIVLLSEAAADSPWVDQEVSWWLEHKGPERMLLVQIDGRVVWMRGKGFSPDSTSVPPALRKVSVEPRWVDLSWFGQPDSLRRDDPRFTEVVLQLFCPIHALERSEAVAMRDANVRRAKQLARGAITTLSILLLVAIIATSVAVQQRGEAIDQARVATGRQLAARGSQLVATDIGRARLLTAQGWELVDDTDTRSALLGAVNASPQLDGQVSFPDNVSELWVSRDRTVTVALTNGDLRQWRPGTRETTLVGRIDGGVDGVTTSADGDVVGSWYGHDGGDSGFSEVALFAEGHRLDLPGASEGPAAISPSGQSAVYFVDRTQSHEIEHPFQGEYEVHLATISSGRLTQDSIIGVVDQDPDQIRWGDNGRLTMLYNPDISAGTATIEIGTWRLNPLTIESWSALGAGYGFEFGGVLSTGGEYAFTGAEVVPATADFPKSSAEHPAHGTSVPGVTVSDGSTEVGLAVSPDGSRVVSAEQNEIEVRDVGDSASSPITITGSRRLGDVAMPDRDHVVSVDGSLVSLWSLTTQHSLVSVHEVNGPDIGCGAKTCVPSPVLPNADGSLDEIDALNGYWLYRPREGDATQLPGDFLGWMDTDSYFASNTVDSQVQLQLWDAGATRPTRSWLVPGLNPQAPDYDGIWAGAWRAADGQFVAVADKSSLHVTPGEKFPTLQTTMSIVRVTPDEAKITVTPSSDHIDDLSSDGTSLITSVTADDKEVWKVVDFASGSVLRESPDELRFAGLHDVVLAQSGSRTDETLLADSTHPELQFTTKGSGRIVVSPGDDYVVSVPSADRLDLHSRSDGGQIIEFGTQNRYASAAGAGFSGDSLRLFLVDNAADKDEVARVRELDLSPNTWVSFACATVQRPLTVEEWTRITGQPAPADLVCS